MIAAISLLLGTTIGLFLGLFGGGGATLAVPVFVYVLHYGASEAIAMSLVVVGVTSLIGSVRAWRAGDVRPRSTLLLGSVAMIGAYAGARAAAFVSDGVQLALFAVVLLSSGALLLRARPEPGESNDAPEPPTDGAQLHPAWWLIVITGATVGVMTGLAGVGGGFLVVPALLLLGLPLSAAVGTSLVVIAMNSAAGLVGYLHEVQVPWTLVGEITAAAVVGFFGGDRIASSIPERTLRRAFAAFLLVVGAFVLLQNGIVLAAVDHAAATLAIR